jgi:transposase
MRGADVKQGSVFSYVSLEARVQKSHPLRRIREMVDAALVELSPEFEALYSKVGRPSIPPEKLLRALLLQILFTIRSERMLMEQLDYNLLFRWFVGLGMDDPVWVPTVFTKNRERLLAGDIALSLFRRVLKQAKKLHFLSDEHFTVDGTLIEAWASQKSFRPKEAPPESGPPDDPGNPAPVLSCRWVGGIVDSRLAARRSCGRNPSGRQSDLQQAAAAQRPPPHPPAGEPRRLPAAPRPR